MSQLQSILDVPMRCEACGTVVSRLGDCEPCIASDGGEGTGFGCPLPVNNWMRVQFSLMIAMCLSIPLMYSGKLGTKWGAFVWGLCTGAVLVSSIFKLIGWLKV